MVRLAWWNTAIQPTCGQKQFGHELDNKSILPGLKALGWYFCAWNSLWFIIYNTTVLYYVIVLYDAIVLYDNVCINVLLCLADATNVAGNCKSTEMCFTKMVSSEQEANMEFHTILKSSRTSQI